ncbi:MAG: PAS domain-containing protein, partial [Kiritimatiellae bacterium]|nr:PAS domain-containing protein [Kiritimatiellia bacterium]
MPRKKLFWQLFGPFVAILLAAVAALCWYATRAMRTFYFERTAEDLGAQARVFGMQAETLVSQQDFATLDALCKEIGRAAGSRLTVILPAGLVVADSDEDPTAMDNHADRPEVVDALRKTTGRATRYSNTLKSNMMYVAQPLQTNGQVMAVLRVARPLTVMEATLRAIVLRIAGGGVVTAIVAGLLGLYFTARVSRPLGDMTRAAEHFAHGDFGLRVPIQDTRELGALADSMNWMASQLDEKIQTVQRQKNELETVLASMAEGVIAVDGTEHVISMNRAAATLLQMDAAQAAGRSIQEAVRHSEIQDFVRRALAGAEPVESDITLHEDKDTYLQAHGTMLCDAHGQGIGALVVLHDVTRLRRLENVRRDFVANVSHELKTPITSIKGFVETLLDGAAEDAGAARRFLEIIAKQADRLNAIVTDLLSLSRIEQEADRREIELVEAPLREVIESALQACRPRAKEKEVALQLACDAGLRARLSPDLLEQAVINLVDNAVKYSEAGQPVRVEASASASEVRISVRDEGCGIAKEHLPRLFERFYRVDKARSRTLGGTGLGLSIVKHIAQAHGGSVDVESEPGKGSMFTIRLPR